MRDSALKPEICSVQTFDRLPVELLDCGSEALVCRRLTQFDGEVVRMGFRVDLNEDLFSNHSLFCEI